MSNLKNRPPNAENAAGTGSDSRAFFENLSGRYARVFDAETRSGAAVLFQLRRKLALELASGPEHRRLLDIATGTGEITYSIASNGDFDELHLNDISPGMLSKCRSLFDKENTSAIVWTNQNAFDLLKTTEPNKFDVVLCLGLIAHTGQLAQLLPLIKACLRPGGTLVLQSSLADHFGVWLTVCYARSPFRRVHYKVSAFSKGEILAVATACGFEVAEVQRYGLCLPFGDRLLKEINYGLEAAYAHKLKKTGGEALFKLRKPVERPKCD
jgi:2-polyprenyl-3-methyl-5-hydroxy-6-metoxy-1,4-benzoquinol methylase